MRERVIQSLVQWCEEQRKLYKRQLALMLGNQMRTGEQRDGQMVDTTEESIERVQGLLGEIEELLAKYAKATLH